MYLVLYTVNCVFISRHLSQAFWAFEACYFSAASHQLLLEVRMLPAGMFAEGEGPVRR